MSKKTSKSKKIEPEITVSDPAPGGRLYRVTSPAGLADPGLIENAVSLFVPADLVTAALDNSVLDDFPILAVNDLTMGLTCDGAFLTFESEAQIAAAREQLGEDGNLAVEVANRHDGLIAGEAGADLLVLSAVLDREERAELTAWWADVVTLPLAVPIGDRSDERFWLDLGADYTVEEI